MDNVTKSNDQKPDWNLALLTACSGLLSSIITMRVSYPSGPLIAVSIRSFKERPLSLECPNRLWLE